MTKHWFFGKSDQVAHEHSGKYYYSSSLFSYTWEQLVTAFWLRYPNPYSSHVLSEDVLDRRLTDDGKVVTIRVLSKTNHMPKWGERFIRGPQHVYIVEESIVDPVNKTLTTYSKNVGYTKVMTVDEKCVYQPVSSDPSMAELARSACIESHVFGFAKAIQAFGVERYKRNTTKTTNGFLYILEHLFAASPASDKGPESLSSRISALTAKAETFREQARKAKEMAKTKTSDFLHASNTSGVPQSAS
ncbi:PRELI domain-containing protein 1, mitochondrial-like [Paramacrobiotus metropolitanus]|uniref:PRELI domain-containing protein 1, mitochondrial-like n=1 Tax=Paramacrobiotus metropolitanus TaxID=2943436 RepID=UPI002445A31F|nr:PRELI domain-containing protein 1, mitochondrial-like [Paramacrobiotus metropolitanus]